MGDQGFGDLIALARKNSLLQRLINLWKTVTIRKSNTYEIN